MDLNPDEVRIKQEMADACEQVYGILDGTKWHRSALLSFVAVRRPDGIVTDSSAPADEVEAWRAAGVEVVTADAGAARAAAGPARATCAARPQRRGRRADDRRSPPSTSARRAAASRSAGSTATGSSVEEVHRFANVPVEAGGTLHWDVLAPVPATCSTGCGPRRRGGRDRLGRRSTRGRSTSASSTRAAACSRNPVHYRDARRAAAFERVLERVPGARAVRAHRDPAPSDQHDLRARGDGGRGRSGARRRPSACC